MHGFPITDPPSSSEPLPGQSLPRWRWAIQLLLLTAYVLIVGLMGLNQSEHHQAPMLPGTSLGLLMTAGVELTVFAIVFGLAWLAARPSRDDLLLRWRGSFSIVALGLGYSVALRVALAMVMFGISAALVASGTMSLDSLQEFFRANQPRTDAMVDTSAVRNPVYLFLLLTVISFVVAGLREELWRSAFLAGFRALAPKLFGSLKGQFAAVAVAAVVFGVGHLAMGPLAASMAGLLGFGLGTIMVLHRSIWPAVIAHGFFDATTFLLLRWIQTEKLLTLSVS